MIVRGHGARIYDDRGRSYLDGLAGLFVVQAGHGRKALAEAAARQAEQLAFFPIWSYAHPSAIELSHRLAAAAPGDLNRVFFTTGGGEAVETAWKAAKQYFKLVGKPLKTKVISRAVAYHGTTQGALSITGVPALKEVLATTLQRAVGDKQHRVRGMAASHLGVLQDLSVVPLLVKALEDDHAYVRSCAALALGRLRATEAKERLATVMKEDWDQTVRSRAKEALERIGV